MTQSPTPQFTLGLVQAIAEAEELIRTGPHSDNEQIIAAGMDYLACTIRGVIQTVQHGDKRRVSFVESTGPYTKMGLDNPDTIYYHANIQPSNTYEVVGTRGSTVDVSFQILAGDYTPTEVPGSATAFDDRDFQIDSEGHFTLVFGPPIDNKPDNYYFLPEGASILAVREVFSDWDTERHGRISIRRIDEEAMADHIPGQATHSVMTYEQTEAYYGRIARSIVGRIKTWLEFPNWFYLNEKVNTLGTPRLTPGGLSTQYSSSGHFDLPRDKAMIITIDKSQAPYQGFQLGNMWYVSMPYVDHQTSLTADQAYQSPDGKIRLVLAHEPVGHHNWIELLGFERGYMQFRWQRVEAPITPEQGPTLEIVDLADVPKLFATDPDARCDRLQWQQRITARRQAFALRGRS